MTSPDRPILAVSLDGPAHVHDALRVFPDGRGSYATIASAVARLLKERSLVAEAVITGLHPNVTEIFQHLYNLGSSAVVLRPVRAPYDQPFSISPATIDAVKDGYTDFVRFLFAQDDSRLHDCLWKMWLPDDFLGRFLIRISTQSGITHRCPAGKDWVCVDTNGDIYPCPSMIGRPELCLGSLHAGLDEAKRAVYYDDLLVTRKPGCRDCWARFLCGGGCYYAAYLVNRRLDMPDPCDCELMRHLAELAIYTVVRLKEERPGVYASLQQKPR